MSEEKTHHQFYKYGIGAEEWVSGTYTQPWFWESPDTLPYSKNYHAPWETAFSPRETISSERLAHFVAHAVPISKEEYETLTRRKSAIQEEDDRMEYLWDRNPWSFMEDDD